MSDLIVKGFAYTDALIEHASRIEKEIAAANRRLRRGKAVLIIWAAVASLMVVLLTVALIAAVPAIRLVPVLLHTSDDGVTDAEVTTDMLPGDLPTASVQAWLWQYVMHRESYSWTEADDNHYVVMAMSTEAVGKEYDDWISGKNKQSYQNILGDKAVIRVGFREVTNYVPPIADQPGLVTIHFARQVYRKDAQRPDPEETYSVTMKFLKGYKRGLKVRDVMSFNPSRIVITDYPRVENLAAMRTPTP